MPPKSCIVRESKETKRMAITIMTITPAFVDAIEGLQSFVLDNNADCDMAYDWVCEQANVPSFVDNNEAWDMFYDAWQSAAEDAELPDHIIANDYRY